MVLGTLESNLAYLQADRDLFLIQGGFNSRLVDLLSMISESLERKNYALEVYVSKLQLMLAKDVDVFDGHSISSQNRRFDQVHA